MPAVCRKGSSKSTSIERQNWIAASKKTGGRPRRPSCGASRAVSWSTRPLGTSPAAMPCRPVDQHRAALAQRGVIAGPVRPAVAGGRRLAPCDPSKPMDPRSEPSDVRVLQQRPLTPPHVLAAQGDLLDGLLGRFHRHALPPSRSSPSDAGSSSSGGPTSRSRPTSRLTSRCGREARPRAMSRSRGALDMTMELTVIFRGASSGFPAWKWFSPRQAFDPDGGEGKRGAGRGRASRGCGRSTCRHREADRVAGQAGPAGAGHARAIGPGACRTGPPAEGGACSSAGRKRTRRSARGSATRRPTRSSQEEIGRPRSAASDPTSETPIPRDATQGDFRAPPAAQPASIPPVSISSDRRPPSRGGSPAGPPDRHRSTLREAPRGRPDGDAPSADVLAPAAKRSRRGHRRIAARPPGGRTGGERDAPPRDRGSRMTLPGGSPAAAAGGATEDGPDLAGRRSPHAPPPRAPGPRPLRDPAALTAADAVHGRPHLARATPRRSAPLGGRRRDRLPGHGRAGDVQGPLLADRRPAAIRARQARGDRAGHHSSPAHRPPTRQADHRSPETRPAPGPKPERMVTAGRSGRRCSQSPTASDVRPFGRSMGLPALEIDQDGPIGSALAERPIVDAEGCRMRNRNARAGFSSSPGLGSGRDRPTGARRGNSHLAPAGMVEQARRGTSGLSGDGRSGHASTVSVRRKTGSDLRISVDGRDRRDRRRHG